ncbi:hypothetical protein B0H14DRAFT_3159319 [Mycena olivaceomarginata]|nr:hypothetical protein B0H14DRAFT_3159319 [Mycena olivaceomarginata]
MVIFASKATGANCRVQTTDRRPSASRYCDALHLKVDLEWILPHVQASLHIHLDLSPLRTLKTSSPSRFHVSITYDSLSFDHLSPSTIPMIIAPDVTAPHLPVDRAGVGSGTEVERQMTGTVDRDRGECYVDMKKITPIIWSPLRTVVSYDRTNTNHLTDLIVGAKYHTFPHTLSCALQDIGRTNGEVPNGEEPERWWTVQRGIAKL